MENEIAILPKPDWTSGIKDRQGSTAKGLRSSARMALKLAQRHIETAERLLAKAEDLDKEESRAAICPHCHGAV